MAGRDRRQRDFVELLGGGNHDSAARDRAQRRGPFTSFEEGSFAEDSSRPDFGDLPTIDAHRQLRDSGMAGRAQRAVVDQAAAVLILQAALDAEKSSGRAAGELVGRRKARAPRTKAKGSQR